MAEDLDSALQAPGCERLREWVEIGPVQRAALETFAEALAEASRPEVDFRLRGTNMCFSIGNQEFQLAYEPTEPGEFEFMKRMLLHAFRRLMRGQERAIAEPDHETRAELAEQQVVQLAEERDHYRNLWQKAQQAEPDAYGYASRLAVAIWEKHYKETAPHWKPLDDLVGVLTQIDNMAAGMIRLAQQAEPGEPAFHGFMSADGTRVDVCFTPSAPRSDGAYATAYYTTPPQRKPLTDEEIQAAWDSVDMRHPRGNETRIAFARAIEHAHGIGEKK